MTITNASVDAGSPSYWSERRTAFRLIREAEQASIEAARAPSYIHGGFDEDGDVIPVENLAPHDCLDDAVRAVESNALAVSILAAQGRAMIGSYDEVALDLDAN